MFELDNERTSLSISPDRILALVTSLNAPNVVAADLPAEPTRAYICAYREGADRVAFSIHLHRVGRDKGVFYRHEERVVSRDRYDEVMVEALAFAESLGFMMDDQGFRDLPPARQRELMAQAPLFHEPQPPASPAAGAAGPDAGDLLATPSAGADETAAARPAAAQRPRPIATPPTRQPGRQAEAAAPPASIEPDAPERPRAPPPPAPRPPRSVPATPAAEAAEPRGRMPTASPGGAAGLSAAGIGRLAEAGEGGARQATEQDARGVVQRAAAPIGPAAARVFVRLLASL